MIERLSESCVTWQMLFILQRKTLCLSRRRSIRQHKHSSASLMHLRSAPSAPWLVCAYKEGAGLTAASVMQCEGSLTSPVPIPYAIRLICDLWNYSSYQISPNQWWKRTRSRTDTRTHVCYITLGGKRARWKIRNLIVSLSVFTYVRRKGSHATIHR